ncbi:MAG: ABC transporter permease [Lachnospiraceae bacterium]|nr:ABC transporter permease [Lachnospiraceae bacterium]
MHNTVVIIKKQLRDTVRNKTILIQFILFPLMTVIMENAVNIEGMQEHFFTRLFAVMYIGMAPLMATTAVISEEKEKNTLRVLLMADITPVQYLAGIGVYVWTICMLGAAVMSATLRAGERPVFLLFMGAGFILSILAGACIGILSKNQMTATSVSLPIMMVLAFAPMLSMFNKTIEKFSAVAYTQQIKLLIDRMSLADVSGTGTLILIGNALACILLFLLAYRKKGLE